jgi:hypothetical protein
MSWTRVPLAALVVCALLGGSAGCGSSGAHERAGTASPSPVGKLLDDTDEQGRHYRQVGKKGGPKVGIEVQPDSDESWDVTLTVHDFRFSPAGTPHKAVAGRGVAVLFLDGRTLAELRTADYHLAAALVPRGTHHVTARLYADDRTVWAIGGKPVESTADITQSEPGVTPSVSDNDPEARTGTGGSPDPGGKAS